MPTPSPRSAKINTTASAWSRLVQLTRTASNAATRSDEAQSSGSAESLPTTISTITPPTRPVRPQRSNKSPSRSPSTKSNQTSPPQDASAMSRQDRQPTYLSRRAEGDCIEVCPCQDGELPLPDGKCSLIRPNKRNTAASPPKYLDLRSFWAPRTTEKKTTPGYEVAGSSTARTVATVNEQRHDITADAPSGIPHVSRMDGEQTTQYEPAHPTTTDTESNKSQLRRAAKFQIADPACAPPSTMGRLSSPEFSARPSQHSPPVASAPGLQRTRFGVYGVASYGREVVGLATEAVPTGDVVMKNHDDEEDDRAYTEMPLGLQAAEGPEEATTQTLETSHTTESVLRGSSQDSVNRATKPRQLFSGTPSDENTQLATPTSSQEDPAVTPGHPSDNVENESEPAPARKTKRRLTLHSGEGLDGQHARKRQRKTALPMKKKQAVQTTLSLAIGGSAGMRECKVCDTLYNPFHPEDVKVHAKRHAGVLKKRVASV